MTESVITALSYFVSFAGFLWLVTGSFALLAAWRWPRLLESRILGPHMIGRFERTKRNLTLVACWHVSWGLYMVAFPYETPNIFRFVLLAAALAFMFPAIRILRSGRET